MARCGPLWTVDDSEWDAPACTADCPCPLCVWNSAREAELLALHPVCEDEGPVLVEWVPCAVCSDPAPEGLHASCAASIGDSVEIPAA